MKFDLDLHMNLSSPESISTMNLNLVALMAFGIGHVEISGDLKISTPSSHMYIYMPKIL
jgi:hypothetical protein